MSIPDHVVVPKTFTSGGTIYVTMKQPDGYYAVLRGKTMQDADFVFKIKWALGQRGDFDSEFYFINVVTRKKGWQLPDLGADAVPPTLLSAIGHAAAAASSPAATAAAASPAAASPASAAAQRPSAPTKEVAAAGLNSATPPATPRQTLQRQAALDAAFASPALARQQPGGGGGAGDGGAADFASPGAARQQEDQPFATPTTTRAGSSPSPVRAPEPVAPVPLKPQHQQVATVASPQPTTPTTLALRAGSITAKAVADSLYGGFDERDALDVPLLKYELVRLQQSLQDRDQVIAQFQSSFESHQSAIRALSLEVHRLKDSGALSPARKSPSPTRGAADNNNSSSSSGGTTNNEDREMLVATANAHKEAAVRAENDAAALRRELAVARAALEREQGRSASAAATATATAVSKDQYEQQLADLRADIDRERAKTKQAERDLKAAKQEAHRETEALKKALEHAQEAGSRSADSASSAAASNASLEQALRDLEYERARIAKIEAVLGEIESSALVTMRTATSSDAGSMNATSSSGGGGGGTTAAVLRVPSNGSSPDGTLSAMRVDAVDLALGTAEEVLSLRKEVRQLRRTLEEKADITITPPSPEYAAARNAKAAAPAAAAAVDNGGEQVLRGAYLSQVMIRMEAEQRCGLLIQAAAEAPKVFFAGSSSSSGSGGGNAAAVAAQLACDVGTMRESYLAQVVKRMEAEQRCALLLAAFSSAPFVAPPASAFQAYEAPRTGEGHAVAGAIAMPLRHHELLARHFLQRKACELSQSAVALARKAAEQGGGSPGRGGWQRSKSSDRRRIAAAENIAKALADSVQGHLRLMETAASLTHNDKVVELDNSIAATATAQ